jgi:hypothetical protein
MVHQILSLMGDLIAVMVPDPPWVLVRDWF